MVVLEIRGYEDSARTSWSGSYARRCPAAVTTAQPRTPRGCTRQKSLLAEPCAQPGTSPLTFVAVALERLGDMRLIYILNSSSRLGAGHRI